MKKGSTSFCCYQFSSPAHLQKATMKINPLLFADSGAMIKRQNDTLIHGKEAIKNFYSTPF
jgi:hypothetical protein